MPTRPDSRGATWPPRPAQPLPQAELREAVDSGDDLAVRDAVSQLAIPFIAAVILKAPPGEVGLLATIEFLPFLLFTLPAGRGSTGSRVAGSSSFGDLGRARCSSASRSPAAGVLTIWQLYLVGFVNGVMTVFFDVADQSYLPAHPRARRARRGQLEAPDQPVRGDDPRPADRRRDRRLLTAPVAVLARRHQLLGSAGLIFSIRKGEPKRTPPTDADGQVTAQPSIRAEIFDGLHFVLRHQYLRNIAATTGLSNLFSNIAFAIFAVYAYRTLELTPQVGVIGGLGSIGILLGALVTARIAGRIGVGRTIVRSIALSGPATLIVPIAPPDTAVRCSSLRRSSSPASATSSTTSTRSASARPSPRTGCQGRMNATMRFLVWGTIPIGSIVGGLSPRSAVEATWRAGHRRRPRLLRLPADPVLAGPVAQRIPSPPSTPSDTELLDADAGMASPGSSLD